MTATTPAKIQVFTYKDGLLARLAHDLRLSLARFEITREGDEIRGRFWPGSLTVDGAVGRGGELDTRALSASDRSKIAGNIAEHVLDLARFPEASFAGKLAAGEQAGEQAADGAHTLVGTLTLVGRAVPLRVCVRAAGGRLVAEVPLVPSRWGIAPYRALAGAIKLQDRVLVTLDLPANMDRWSGIA